VKCSTNTNLGDCPKETVATPNATSVNTEE